uniref:UCR_hinge domain-containing protein n=1 Tax=Anisakis simplex TaxID=6269 RepID=A0A0M3KG80_ANISI
LVALPGRAKGVDLKASEAPNEVSEATCAEGEKRNCECVPAFCQVPFVNDSEFASLNDSFSKQRLRGSFI